MNDLLEKLSSYNLFNYLFPGVLFAAAGTYLTSYSLLMNDVLVGVFIYYFYGLVISRIGSLVLEPIFGRFGVVRFASYDDFVVVSENDNKLELLSEQKNMYRTLTSTFLCLLLLYIFDIIGQYDSYLLSSLFVHPFIVFLLFLLFTLSYRKQGQYILSRIARLADEVNNERKGEGNETNRP